MYTRKLRCMDTLKELNISKDDFVIYGSAPMVLRGLKEKNNDSDYWFEVGDILTMEEPGDAYQYVFDNITYNKVKVTKDWTRLGVRYFNNATKC